MTLHKSQAERRREILAAARRRFVTDGYPRARLGDIASDAGLSKGGVYFHFKSKRELFDALIVRDFARSIEALELMRAVEGTVADKLVLWAQAGAKAVADDPDLIRFQVVTSEMALAHADVRARLREMHAAFVGEVAALLSEGVDAGELRPDLDTDAGARLLVAVMNGVRGAIATEVTDRQQLDRLIRCGVELLAHGLITR